MSFDHSPRWASRLIGWTFLFLVPLGSGAEEARPNPAVPIKSEKTATASWAKTSQKIPEYPFKCDRLILVGGKTLPCDSPLARDGEYLRPLLSDSPDAIEELDTYQRNRKKVRFAAYTGTFGLAMALTAPLSRGLFVPKGAEHDDDRKSAETAIRWSGFGITIGSVLFGLSSLHSNEDHLKLAVLRYNTGHPDKPIELLFHTDF